MKKGTKTALIITIIYAIFTLICVFHHETWADEAQVWLLCENLSLSEMFGHLHKEGHPIFLYLLIMPFAKLTSDIIYMQLICWIFMVASIFLLFRYSPFHIVTKFAITLSAGYIYFLPVIARDYSLMPLLMFLTAILYLRQKEHPILYALVLSLTACTHIIMFVFVVALLFMFICDNLIKSDDKKRFVLPVLIIVFSLIYVIWQLHDTIGSNCCIESTISRNDIINNIIFVFPSFFKNAYNYMIFTHNNNNLFHPIIDTFSISTLIIVFFICFLNLFFISKKWFFFILFSIGFQFFIYITYYHWCIYPTRIFIAFTIIIFAFWIVLNNGQTTEKNKRIINIALSILFILTSYNGFNYWIMDLKNDYSGAKKLAEYIVKNIDKKNAIFLYSNEPYVSALKYYLKDANYLLISTLHSKENKYTTWEYGSNEFYSEDKWLSVVSESEQKNLNSDIYVVSNLLSIQIAGEISDKYFEEVFRNEPTIKEDEEFHLYKYKKP